MKTHWNIHSFLSGTHCHFLWIAAGLIAIHLAYGAERTLPVFPYEGNFSESFTVGETWIYEHHGVRSSGNIGQPVNGDRVEEIVSKQTANDRELWIVKMKWGDTDFDPSRSFIDDNRMLHRVESGADIISFSPPPYMDWLDLAPGERKTIQTIASSERGDSLFTISVERLADETIVVPAGEFADCIKVGMTVNYAIPQKSYESIDFQHTYWYHPNVNGFVKETFSLVSSENTGGDSAIGGVAFLKSHSLPQE